jgi:hypothetical protein
MPTRRVPAWAGAVLAVGLMAAAAAGVAWNPRAAEAVPSRLSHAEFWRLIDDFSEPNGTFRSDNLLSNETWMQTVIPELMRFAKSGRVYMGVGPEQNFTYIAALRPKMVFIVDVRRGNLDLHLMYRRCSRWPRTAWTSCRGSSRSRGLKAWTRRALPPRFSPRSRRSSRARRSTRPT